MATGYLAGGSDLDAIFAARVSAAAANTGYLSNGGVDISQRFEPRGGATAIGNTNLKAGATDLAQIFRGISTLLLTTHSMVANKPVSNDRFGYASTDIAAPFGSFSPTLVGSNDLQQCFFLGIGGQNQVAFRHPSVTPVDTDSTWQRLVATGVFNDSAGATVSRTLTRSAATSGSTGSGSGWVNRIWLFAGAPAVFISGNTYAINIYHF